MPGLRQPPGPRRALRMQAPTPSESGPGHGQGNGTAGVLSGCHVQKLLGTVLSIGHTKGCCLMRTYQIAFQLAKSKVFVFRSDFLFDNEVHIDYYVINFRMGTHIDFYAKNTLRPHREAIKFFKKWGDLRETRISQKIYDGIDVDLSCLKRKYNFFHKKGKPNEYVSMFDGDFSESSLAEWSNQTPKYPQSILVSVLNIICDFIAELKQKFEIPNCWKYYQ